MITLSDILIKISHSAGLFPCRTRTRHRQSCGNTVESLQPVTRSSYQSTCNVTIIKGYITLGVFICCELWPGSYSCLYPEQVYFGCLMMRHALVGSIGFIGVLNVFYRNFGTGQVRKHRRQRGRREAGARPSVSGDTCHRPGRSEAARAQPLRKGEELGLESRQGLGGNGQVLHSILCFSLLGC